MNRKIGQLLLLLAITGLFLAACGERDENTVYIQSASASYRVQTITRDPETRLTITIVGQDADMEDMQNTFFSEAGRAQVAAGSYVIECGEIVYGTAESGEAPDVLATLVFEVPADFPDSFSLYANGADAVSLQYIPTEE